MSSSWCKEKVVLEEFFFWLSNNFSKVNSTIRSIKKYVIFLGKKRYRKMSFLYNVGESHQEDVTHV